MNFTFSQFFRHFKNFQHFRYFSTFFDILTFGSLDFDIATQRRSFFTRMERTISFSYLQGLWAACIAKVIAIKEFPRSG
jgi:hypothetical protein